MVFMFSAINIFDNSKYFATPVQVYQVSRGQVSRASRGGHQGVGHQGVSQLDRAYAKAGWE